MLSIAIRETIVARKSILRFILTVGRFALEGTAAMFAAAFVIWLFSFGGSRALGHALTDHEFAELMTAVATVVALALILRTWLGAKLSLLSNAPLRDTIASLDIEAICKSTIPVICTATTKVEYYDPFYPDEHSPKVPRRQVKAPVYMELNRVASTEEGITWLLQTAAIPEIFPSKQMRGLYVLDGGTIDNTPILGVLDGSPEIIRCIVEGTPIPNALVQTPDVIIVIYLDHRLSRTPDLGLSERQRIWTVSEYMAKAFITEYEIATKIRGKWRHALLREFSRRQEPGGWASRGSDPFPDRDLMRPTVLPENNPVSESFTRAAFVPVVPSRRLEWFPKLHSGTLNFWAWKARRLVALGYEDTLQQVLRIAREGGSTSGPSLDTRA
jgi:hypothetical protein